MTPLLTPHDLAAYLQVPLETIYRWRRYGNGPKACKVGRHLRFRQADVEAWLNSRGE